MDASYNYIPLNLTAPVTAAERQFASARLGDRINALYESGAKSTPMGTKRIAVAVAVALAAIAALGFAIAAAAVTWPFAIPTVIVGAAAIGGFVWIKTSVDLDNPKERAEVQHRIADQVNAMAFRRMCSKYDEDKILGYKLLDKVVRHAPQTDDAEAKIYGFAHRLIGASQEVKRRATDDRRTVQGEYEHNCEPFKRQLDLHLEAISAGQSGAQAFADRPELRDDPRYQAALEVNAANADAQRAHFRRQYELSTAVFRQGRDQALRRIYVAEEQALDRIDAVWSSHRYTMAAA